MLKKKVLGFTFIELIIVTAILPIISLAMYSTFNNGIKIWYKVNRQIPQEDLNIFLEKLTSNLKNSFGFKNIYFSGKENMMRFPTLVSSSQLGKRTVGEVIYLYDSDDEILIRQRRDFSQIYKEQGGTTTDTLRNIKSLRFKYYFFDLGKQGYSWVEEWGQEYLPLAVSIELEIKDGDSTNAFFKTVSIPAAQQETEE